MRISKQIVLGLTLLLFCQCDLFQSWSEDRWEDVSAELAGMNSTLLREAIEYAGGSGYIIRGGKLVMYWGSPTRLYDMKSTTKSIGVTALGLAIKDGEMDLNDKCQKYYLNFGLPPKENSNTGWLDDITLFHLATHTAGFSNSGGYAPLLFEPGTAWAYSDSGANWLADCVTLAYGQDLRDLMFSRIFTPLGISSSDLTWRSNAYREDTINGIKRREFSSGISANVDAMARIGYLYLRRGRWNGLHIIPERFVDMVRNTAASVAGVPVVNDVLRRFADASKHYGLLWWNNADGSLVNVPRDAFWSWGLYDSLIVVIPSLDIVVARAGSSWVGDRTPSYYKILEPFLDPIVASVNYGAPHSNSQAISSIILGQIFEHYPKSILY